MLYKGINYWSYPGGLEGTLDPFEFLVLAKEHGYEAAELCIGEGGAFGLDATEDRCRALRSKAGELGLRLDTVASGTYWTCHLADDNPDVRNRALANLVTMTQICEWLGAKVLLTIPGAVDVFFLPESPVTRYDLVLERASLGLSKALEYAEKHRVKLAIENVWNKFLLSPTEMARFIDSFGSPWIGSYFDVGNVLAFGYPEQWIRILDHRVAAVHFKDYRKAVGTADGFVDLLAGDVNWPAVIEALEIIGYDGPVTAEMIPHYTHYPVARAVNTSSSLDFILGRRTV